MMNHAENLNKINHSFFKLSLMTEKEIQMQPQIAKFYSNSCAEADNLHNSIPALTEKKIMCNIQFEQKWRRRKTEEFNSSSSRGEDNLYNSVPAEAQEKTNRTIPYQQWGRRR
jgi:hypothetical protein